MTFGRRPGRSLGTRLMQLARLTTNRFSMRKHERFGGLGSLSVTVLRKRPRALQRLKADLRGASAATGAGRRGSVGAVLGTTWPRTSRYSHSLHGLAVEVPTRHKAIGPCEDYVEAKGRLQARPYWPALLCATTGKVPRLGRSEPVHGPHGTVYGQPCRH